MPNSSQASFIPDPADMLAVSVEIELSLEIDTQGFCSVALEFFLRSAIFRSLSIYV